MPLIKLAYRISAHAVTGKTPFFANKGFETDTILEKQTFKEFVYSADI